MIWRRPAGPGSGGSITPSSAGQYSAPPPPRHRETDPVAGAEFERTLTFTVAAATEDELRAVLAPMLAAADGIRSGYTLPGTRRPHRERTTVPGIGDRPVRRRESAYLPAIDALGRMATAGSRAHLKNLLSNRKCRKRLASDAGSRTHRASRRRGFHGRRASGCGGRRDVEALRGVRTWPYWRRWCGSTSGRCACIRTGRASRRNRHCPREHALPRRRAGRHRHVGQQSRSHAVCGAMRTLTHQNWCDGSDADPAATRRQWLRRFNDAGSNLAIFGPNDCWTDPLDAARFSATPPRPRPVPSGPPRIVAPRSCFAAPNAFLRVSGYDFETQDRRSLRAVFLQGTRNAPPKSEAWGSIRVVAIPPTTRSTFGCLLDSRSRPLGLVIEANGVRSDPIPVEIRAVSDFVLGGMSPTRPHPSQLVRVTTRPFNQVVEYVRLTDSQGRQWQLRTGGSSAGVGFRLPDDIADGEASVQAGRTEYGVERLSEPLRFSITSGPLPPVPLLLE